MIKHYKILFFGLVVFIGLGVMPAEQPQTTKLSTNISSKVVEVPPPDLSELEENSRYLHELAVENMWLLEKERKNKDK